MIIGLAAAFVLARQCAPAVAPETLLSVVQVESHFDPLAIGLNGKDGAVIASNSRAEAAAKATALIAAGRNIDLGIAQINSRNLAWLGLGVDQAFDPCTNLAAAARILRRDYDRSDAKHSGAQAAIRTTLSLYNTGRQDRGFTNGYVAKVVKAAGHIVPALAAEPEAALLGARPSSPAAASWDVFGQADRSPAAFVISASSISGDPP
jgi:type IV secretion system protein VirB1